MMRFGWMYGWERIVDGYRKVWILIRKIEIKTVFKKEDGAFSFAQSKQGKTIAGVFVG